MAHALLLGYKLNELVRALDVRGHRCSRRGQRRRDVTIPSAFAVFRLITSSTAENIFTNLLNVVAQTDIDFPVVHAAEAA